MTRNHRSARAAGAQFERTVADYLAAHVDDRIDRAPQNGARDRGDITGLRHTGQRVVIEVKNETRGLDLAGWAKQGETERGNDDALAWLVTHKRHGVADPGDQWVTTTARELVALLNGDRAHTEEEDQ